MRTMGFVFAIASEFLFMDRECLFDMAMHVINRDFPLGLILSEIRDTTGTE